MAEPPLSEEFTVAGLDAEVRRDLRGLQKDTADSVARHLVAAGNLVDEDPELALAHARYARRRASRIAVVREAAGIAAYHAGEWTEALAELRAARRMGGGPVHLPVMADIERALGRPERAVDIARGPEASELGTAERIELAIVGAGARRDLGELDAAVIALQVPELEPTRRDPWSARLFYAYADNLLAAGRESDALQWFVHAVDADTTGATDAAERIAVLTGEEPEDDADDFEFGEEEAPASVGSPAQVADVPAGDSSTDGDSNTVGDSSSQDADVVEPADEGDRPDTEDQVAVEATEADAVRTDRPEDVAVDEADQPTDAAPTSDTPAEAVSEVDATSAPEEGAVADTVTGPDEEPGPGEQADESR